MTAAVKKTIKAAEVANHTTAEDCWLIIHGKVYDATTFLNDHPGGAGVLLEVAGKDSSDEFDAVGHTDAAMELLERYYIGDLEVDPNAPVVKKGSKSSGGMSPVLIMGVLLVIAAVIYLFVMKQ